MPLTVWLVGDEPHFEEFALDADQAMVLLGIRRSRLTQISGRELRVGKVRIDRYTRAVYRLEDLEAYRSWTRRTAAHQRSAEVVKDAASRLDSVRGELVGALIDSLERTDQTWRAELKEGVGTIRAERVAGIRALDREISELRALVIDVKNGGLRNGAEARDADHCIQAKIKDTVAAVAMVSAMVSENGAEQRLSSEGVGRAIAKTTHRIDVMNESVLAKVESAAMEGLDLWMQALSRLNALDTRLRAVEAAIRAVCAPAPEPTPARPRRRTPLVQRRRGQILKN